jgi:endonuclease YncB( thermonuclease family)
LDKQQYLIIFSIIIVSLFSFALLDSNLYSNREEQDDIELEGIVNYVVDGDTLDINDIRIRLALVDTPER